MSITEKVASFKHRAIPEFDIDSPRESARKMIHEEALENMDDTSSTPQSGDHNVLGHVRMNSASLFSKQRLPRASIPAHTRLSRLDEEVPKFASLNSMRGVEERKIEKSEPEGL